MSSSRKYACETIKALNGEIIYFLVLGASFESKVHVVEKWLNRLEHFFTFENIRNTARGHW